jgi:sec-independent protein translocase protein TatA
LTGGSGSELKLRRGNANHKKAHRCRTREAAKNRAIAVSKSNTTLILAAWEERGNRSFAFALGHDVLFVSEVWPMFGLGLGELLVILVIVMVVFNRRLPDLGESLGKSVRKFRNSLHGNDEIDVTPRDGSGKNGEGETPR